MKGKYSVRKADVADVKAIHGLLMQAALKGQLLPRALAYLYGHIRNFFVCEQEDGTIVGCCALAPVWEDLAEVCSLVVREDLRGEGLGRLLVEACMDDSGVLGVSKLFALTYREKFFNHLGFATVEKDVLPQKIWADCVHCPKYPDCDEFAVLFDMADRVTAAGSDKQ
ncbi:MAG: N-acetyltransferase [Desulfovibrionaceae bacterium]|nr:N-acetyltransferase [Desulfovibrionaceae bacterium]